MCQLNSSHICPYFLHLLDTFTEKIKKKKQKEQCLQKKSLQKHTAVHHLLPQAGYLITSEKNQRRFQGAPLECTNYILFLKKKWEKNVGRCVVANTLAVDICFKNSSKFLMEFLFVVTEEILYSITAVFDQGSQAKPLIMLVE